LLTLSDGASTLLARDNESLNSLVKVDQLVFRTHGFALDRDHAALHGTTDEVTVVPRVAHVGRTSWQFVCAVRADDERVATTRGTFVHVDATTRRPAPLPETLKLALSRRLSPDEDDPFPGGAALDALKWTAVDADAWRLVLRRSDADGVGHVNNARWAAFAYDVLAPGARVSAMDVEYRSETLPGQELRCVAATAPYLDCSATRLSFFSDAAEDACTVVTLLGDSEG